MNRVKLHYKQALAYYEVQNFLMTEGMTEDSIIVCVGTDRAVGDSLGPLVGTFLKEQGFPLPVYGTLEEPVHALNIDKRLEEIKKRHPHAHIIAVDACLGDSDSIGEIQVRDYPIHPGKGVGKSLPEVGDISIIGIVDTSNDELLLGTNVRLSLIYKMADIIAEGLVQAYIKIKNKEEDKCY